MVAQYLSIPQAHLSNLFCKDNEHNTNHEPESWVNNEPVYNVPMRANSASQELTCLGAQFSPSPRFYNLTKQSLVDVGEACDRVYSLINQVLSEEEALDPSVSSLSCSTSTWDSKCDSGLLSLDSNLSYNSDTTRESRTIITKPRKAPLHRKRPLEREQVSDEHPLTMSLSSPEEELEYNTTSNVSVTTERRRQLSLVTAFYQGLTRASAMAISLARSRARMETLSSQILSPASIDSKETNLSSSVLLLPADSNGPASCKAHDDSARSSKRRRKYVPLKTFSVTVTPLPSSREFRLNSEFYRVFALERCMRLKGKLDEDFAGRARYVLEPRVDSQTFPDPLTSFGISERLKNRIKGSTAVSHSFGNSIITPEQIAYPHIYHHRPTKRSHLSTSVTCS